MAGFHSFDIFGPVLVKKLDFLEKEVGGLFVLEDFAEPLLGKGICIEDIKGVLYWGV